MLVQDNHTSRYCSEYTPLQWHFNSPCYKLSNNWQSVRNLYVNGRLSRRPPVSRAPTICMQACIVTQRVSTDRECFPKHAHVGTLCMPKQVGTLSRERIPFRQKITFPIRQACNTWNMNIRGTRHAFPVTTFVCHSTPRNPYADAPLSLASELCAKNTTVTLLLTYTHTACLAGRICPLQTTLPVVTVPTYHRFVFSGGSTCCMMLFARVCQMMLTGEMVTVPSDSLVHASFGLSVLQFILLGIFILDWFSVPLKCKWIVLDTTLT